MQNNYRHSKVAHLHGEMRTNSTWQRGDDNFCSVDVKARVCNVGVEMSFDMHEKRPRHKRGNSAYVNTVLNRVQAIALRNILTRYINDTRPAGEE